MLLVGKVYFFNFRRRNFGGLRETAERIGLDNYIDVKLSRLDKADGRGRRNAVLCYKHGLIGGTLNAHGQEL